MPIDIVKKNKKNSTVNLRRKLSAGKEDKKSFEERLEKRFSHLPDLAYKQKVKIMWSTVIFCSGVIVIFWFYLVSRGVLFRTSQDKEEKDDLIKLSELTSGFSKLKDAAIGGLSDKKDVILNLKSQLELEVAKSEVINNLKDDLQKKVGSEYDVESDKVVCSSGNLIVTYPLPNYYIGNPVKILGRGKLPSGEFEVKLEDADGKILGESNGATEKGRIMSAFIVDLNYSNPGTKAGVLQLYTLNEDGESEDNLISMPVNFISDLADWDIYSNEEFGVEFKHPKDLTVVAAQNGLFLNNKDKDEEEAVENRVYIDYFSDIEKLQKYYTPALPSIYDNLDSFLESGNLGGNQKSVYSGGLKFNFTAGIDIYYIIFEKETGEIVVFKSDNKGNNGLEILDQILATFRVAEPDLENWKEHEDLNGEVSLRYPVKLNESEELGQFIFREDDPDGFSFYFFTIEPQIDNLEKWVKESSFNLEEEVIKYEDKSFGDVTYGIYYEAEDAKDEEGVQSSQKSFGYIFNHYGVTYSLRTNKDNFNNTFKNVLRSIKFNSSESEQNLEFLDNNF